MKRLSLFLSGFAAAIAAGAIAFEGCSRTNGHQGVDLQPMATEVGSIAELRYPYFIPNHAGTRMLVDMDSEKGFGMLFCEVPGGKKKWLYEANDKTFVWAHYKLLGWSPDDKLLAYGHQSFPSNTENQIVSGDIIIANGDSGETLATIPASADQANNISQFTWISANAFAFLDAMQDLAVYEQKPEGWMKTHFFTNVTGGTTNEAKVLSAMSSHSVTWRMRGAIWTFDFESGSPVKAWSSYTNNSGTNVLLDSYYAQETGKFLLLCMTGTTRFVYTLNPETKTLTELDTMPGEIQVTVPAWINHGTGYVFYSQEWGHISLFSSLFIKTNVSAEPLRLLKPGEVRIYKIAGDNIFIAGTATNEPPGIWEYNVHSGTLRCVLSTGTLGFQHAECAPFEWKMFTNSDETHFSYHIWTPAHFSPDKKYPLIIGNTQYGWIPYPMAAANAGFFFVTIDRPRGGEQRDEMGGWSEKLMKVYDILAKNPCIDTNRVYLYARCIETEGVSEIVGRRPDLWHGAIILTPNQWPDLSALKLLKHGRILIVDGKLADPGTFSQWREYEKEASDDGLDLTVALLDNVAPHDLTHGVAVQRQRVQELVKFLSNQ